MLHSGPERGGEQLQFHAERDIHTGEEIMNCYGMQD